MIELSNVGLNRDGFSLSSISFHLQRGKIAVLSGEIGSGKTTLVEAICGLVPVSTGQIRLRDHCVDQNSVAQRKIGYVPQDLTLFAHLSVRQNLAFALEIRRWRRSRIDSRVDELASRLKLSQLLDRNVEQLSGGQQKCVAIGRTLAFFPDIVCLDEPFVSLDELSRDQLLSVLKDYHHQNQATILVVTHRPQIVQQWAHHHWRITPGGQLVETAPAE